MSISKKHVVEPECVDDKPDDQIFLLQARSSGLTPTATTSSPSSRTSASVKRHVERTLVKRPERPITPLQTRPSGLTSTVTTNGSSSCTSALVTRHPERPPVKKSESPITPLQTRLCGLTSTETTSSSSSSTSESVKEPESDRFKSTIPSSASQSGSKSKTTTGNMRLVRGSATAKPDATSSSSTYASVTGHVERTPVKKPESGKAKSTTPSSASQSGSKNDSRPKTPTGNTVSGTAKPDATTGSSSSSSSTSASVKTPESGKATPSSASQSGSTNESSPKTTTGNTKSSQGSPKAKPPGKNINAPQKNVKIVPAGNLFPSGKVQITGMTHETQKSMIVGSGTGEYGYGSIIRGNTFPPTKPTTTDSSPSSSGGSHANTSWKIVLSDSNPEAVKEIGNEMFKKGCFTEALKLYDRAIELSPSNATYHSNRAAALSSLGQIGEAINECEIAIRLDPKFVRAHHRLATLLLRLGQVDNAGMHFYSVEDPSDPMVVKMLQQVDTHLDKCTNARRRGEWNVVLTEVSAAMASGANYSPQLAMCKVEALLKLLRLDDAQRELALIPKVEPFPPSFSQTRFFDIIGEAYTSIVKSQMELALGRFENAVTAAEKASDIDSRNSEVEMLYRYMRLIVKARDRGNNLYESERYTEASTAYAEGLKFDPSNATLLCHRAECFFKVGMWESTIEDCNHALLIRPSYTKPRLQRAASYIKLERWAEAVSDYEILRKEMPYEKEIAESLFHAQVALKKSRGEVVLNMEFGGEVEEILSLEELKAALTRPGVSIVHFFKVYDQQSKEVSVYMDALCVAYPSLHFLKVDIGKCPAIGDAERVRVVPTIKIFKLGIQVKVIVCPSKEALENTVRHYGL